MKKLLLISAMFLASSAIGYNLIPTEQLQATPLPIRPSPLEVPVLHTEKKTEPSVIEVIYDLESRNVSVKGNTDAIVNVTTTGELPKEVKYVTKTKVDTVRVGYPFVSAIKKVGERPVSPLEVYEKQRSATSPNDSFVSND